MKNNKNKKSKKKNTKQRSIGLKERLENFFYSDTVASNTTKFLLMFIAVGTVAFGGAVVPGILKVIKEFEMSGGGKIGDYKQKQINNALINLKRQKLIKIVKQKNGMVKVKLTNKGKKRILEFSIDTVKIEKPKKWDGKWRIVMFDIPNELNRARESLRRKVKELGFVQFQKSAWICPYECEDEILFVAEIFGVQRYVEVVTAEKLLHEKIIRKKFKL